MLMGLIVTGKILYEFDEVKKNQLTKEDVIEITEPIIVKTIEYRYVATTEVVTEEVTTEEVTEEPTTEKQKEYRDAPTQQTTEVATEASAPTEYYTPSEGSLTAFSGVNYYGEQKETYYNLPMDQVVANAHNAGIEGEYWVREDGCKMLGDYVMIAANQSVHPYGTVVDTSLGQGIVVDTGSFAIGNPTAVDIATDW